jgi:hypothetical protein
MSDSASAAFGFVVGLPRPIPSSVSCRHMGAYTLQYCEYRAAW